jgi:acyl-CoA reductase-like NAD-dependent aldehyde dehydrogenase
MRSSSLAAHTDTGETFTSRNPATGEVVGTFAVDGPDAVAAAVERARGAAGWWEGLGADGRERRLKAFKALLVRRSDELCELIHRENGKPMVDALTEVILVADHLDWAARKAGKVLARRRVETTLLARNHAAWVSYRPLGVVGVIGPWN